MIRSSFVRFGAALLFGFLGFVPDAALARKSPVSGTWTATGDLGTGRGLHTATLLSNGKVLAAGGDSSSNGRLSAAEVYDPTTAIWSNTGPLAKVRDSHTATSLPDGRVLVAGGEGGAFEPLASAELYDPAAGM